jgi:NADPH:quinone reductase-like Zn-dependent oxidoreductase
MRAFAVRGFGQSPALQDLPVTDVDGAIQIRVRFAGVNPADFNAVDGLTATSRYPFVLGGDFAGIIESVPAEVTDLHAGDRVFGIARTRGSYAECTAVMPLVSTEPVSRIPEGVSDEQAAALPVPAITALGSLEMLHLSAGERVLIMGATGGVGGYAVQIARARGARVIATVRGDADEAKRLGAEEVYDASAGDVLAALRTAHPDGVDAVLDLVNGKQTIQRDAEVLRAGGKLVSTNHAADKAWFDQRKISAQNISGPANPYLTPQGLQEAARLLADGKITARIHATVPLEEAGQILDQLRNGGIRGKAVIKVS